MKNTKNTAVYMDGDMLVIEDGDYIHEIGFCTRNNRESWRWVLRVPKHLAKGRVREIWDALDRPSAYYHGPGRAFAGPCVIYFNGGCLCYDQSGGLDI